MKTLQFAITLMILLSFGCERKQELKKSDENDPRKISYMEAGRAKAAIIRSNITRIKENSAELRRSAGINRFAILKSKGIQTENLTSQPQMNKLKSTQLFPYTYPHLTQIERYSSQQLEAITYLTYDDYNRVQWEDTYTDYDHNGDFTYIGGYLYTYPNDNFNSIIYADHFGADCLYDFYCDFYYNNNENGINFYNLLGCVVKWSKDWNYLAHTTFVYGSASDRACSQIYSYLDGVQIGRRDIEYDSYNYAYKTVHGYDGNNVYYYLETYTYNEGTTYIHGIKNLSVSARYTSANFDYIQNFENADVICKSNDTEWVYRYISTQSGNYDPLENINCFNFKY
jgi:hypothetical protein